MHEKGADQLRSNCETDQRLYFATRIVQFPNFLNPKFPNFTHFQCLYTARFVSDLFRSPEDRFSRVAIQLFMSVYVHYVINFGANEYMAGSVVLNYCMGACPSCIHKLQLNAPYFNV